MKTIIWNSIAIISLIYVLSFAGFLGWMGLTGRMNQDRMNKVYEMFATTIQQEQELAAAAADEEARRLAEEAETRRLTEVDLSALSNTPAEQRTEAIMAVQRKIDDTNAVKRAIELELKELQESKDRYEAMEAQFRKRMEAELEKRNSEDFQKTVTLYELQPPKNVKNIFVNMLTTGNPSQREENLNQVARVLDAMDPRRASDVLKQFKAGDAQDGPNEVALAVEVMERLRTMSSNLVAQLETQG